MPPKKEKKKKAEETPKPLWCLTTKDVLAHLETSEKGLTDEEIQTRQKTYGRNIIRDERKVEKLTILLHQFKSPLIGILVVAGIITFVLKDYTDSIFIFISVLVNTALGFYQENKAETTLASLKTYITKRTRVIRDGKEIEIDAEEIVPGDIIHITSGMRIPADARVVTENSLSIDESILTGESLPVHKHTTRVKEDVIPAERKCMVFGGTFASFGVGTAVVTATGKNTELGKIAALVGKREGETPLQKSITSLALKATGILFVLVAILFAIGIQLGYETLDMFVISVAIAVSAVPEGLPIALTVILAVGVERLAKRKGVVRKLLAAETLGRTTVILTDKTGTLTEAKIELSKVVSQKEPKDVLETALACLDVTIENPDDPSSEWRVMGRPLEQAVVRAALAHHVPVKTIKDETEILAYQPFNAKDKFSASQIKRNGEEAWVYLGAPEMLAKKTDASDKEKAHLLQDADTAAREGGRVLAVVTKKDIMGLLVFKDAVRKGVKEEIKHITEAGVRTVIVTGDHAGTAQAIAREVGIIAEDDEIITGEEFQRYNDAYLAHRLDTIKIFARISPEDKLKIVELYKGRGEIVAMTGDGVNDAPALGAANIGIAMGDGTDVAKGAADLVILDNSFKTITAAIYEGRKILLNLRKTIVYLLSDSLDELFLIGGAFIANAVSAGTIPLPITALQILWINFFSDSLPAIAFAFEDTPDYTKHRPNAQSKKLLDKEMKFLILVIGTISSALLFSAYFTLLKMGFDVEIVKTFTFATLGIYSLLLAFSMRRLKASITTYNPFGNKYLNGGVSIGIVLVLAAIYVPFLQPILQTTPLPLPWLAGVIVFSLINIVAIELGKLLFAKPKP